LQPKVTSICTRMRDLERLCCFKGSRNLDIGFPWNMLVRWRLRWSGDLIRKVHFTHLFGTFSYFNICILSFANDISFLNWFFVSTTVIQFCFPNSSFLFNFFFSVINPQIWVNQNKIYIKPYYPRPTTHSCPSIKPFISSKKMKSLPRTYNYYSFCQIYILNQYIYILNQYIYILNRQLYSFKILIIKNSSCRLIYFSHHTPLYLQSKNEKKLLISWNFCFRDSQNYIIVDW